jgi:U3 small nucleolar RNA-associated protein 20
MKQIPQKPELEKLLVRAVCTIVDNFHFAIAAEPTPGEVEADRRAIEDSSQRRTAKLITALQAEEAKRREQRAAEAPPELRSAASLAPDESELAEPKPAEEEDEDKEGGDEEDDEAEALAAAAAAPEDEQGGATGAGAGAGTAAELGAEGSGKRETPAQIAEREQQLAVRIRDTLARRLIPQLHRYLMSGAAGDGEPDYEAGDSSRGGGRKAKLVRKGSQARVQDVVRAPVAMALIRLLRKLPRDIFQREFAKLVAVLCTQLQRREQVARDATRRTLVNVAEVVGHEYVFYMLTELVRSLTRGFHLHVLGAVVHALIQW